MLHLHLFASLLQTVPEHAPQHVGALKHYSEITLHFFERFGMWGLAAIALLDAALIPLPWQVLLISGVHNDPGRYLLYPLVAAVASAVGSLVPFYVGRLGGEIFLLGKINRARYEKLRDRFERQEFLAIFVPAMGPPPTPIKLFEFCAGVFEMKVVPFFFAIMLGKLVQFVIFAVITHVYGPTAFSALSAGLRQNGRLLLTVVGLLMLALAIWVARKIFGRKGTHLPIEDPSGEHRAAAIVEE